MSLVSKFKVTRLVDGESVDVGSFYASDGDTAKTEHISAKGLGKKEIPAYEATLSVTEVEITKGGKYIGTDSAFFVGERALLMFYNSESIVRAQFNKGAVWKTHSWLTFDRADWEIDGE